eukprot:5490469-Ditylum_brightwellii.AAC.1
MEENHHKRRGNEKDGRENKNNKRTKKAKFGNGNEVKNKGSENLWALFKNDPDSKDCPKHGKGHNAGSCYNNPYKKIGGNNSSQGGQGGYSYNRTNRGGCGGGNGTSQSRKSFHV